MNETQNSLPETDEQAHRALPARYPELPQLLTIREVGELLSVSERTVRRLTGRGLRSIRLGGVVRFDPADVRRFLAARRS